MSENHSAAYNFRLPRSFENYFYAQIEKAWGENRDAAYKDFCRCRQNGNEMLFLTVRCIFGSFRNGIIRKVKIRVSGNHGTAYKNFCRCRKNGNEMHFLAVHCTSSSFEN